MTAPVLPTALAYGQVRWQVVSTMPDTTVDPDALPQPAPVTGTVVFTPSAPLLLAGGATPVTVIGAPQAYSLDSAGILRDGEGRSLVTLVATDAPGVSPTGWTWTATYKLTGYNRASFSFALPAGQVVDLTTVAPLPAAGGTPIVQGPPGPAGGVLTPAQMVADATVQAAFAAAGHTHKGLQVTAEAFGAVGNGTTDDTAAIQAALNSFGAAGGTVVLRGATYKVSTLTVPAGVDLVGVNRRSTILYSTAATGNVVTLNVASALRRLRIGASVVRTAGAHVRMDGNAGTVESCDFTEYFLGAEVGTEGGVLVVQPRFVDCSFYSPVIAAGSGGIHFRNWSNAYVSRCSMAGPALPAVQPSFGLRFWNGDTALVSDTNITCHGRALFVDTPAGRGCYALSVVNCLFDSAGAITGATAGIHCADLSPAGNVYNTKFANCWFGLSANPTSSGCALAPTATGNVDGITFDGCEFTDNTDGGLIAVGPRAKNWVVTGGHSSGSTYGIRAAAATTDFVITGHRAGNIAGRGANTYGILTDAAAQTRYVITGNLLSGNTTSGFLDQSTGTPSRLTTGNVLS